MNINWWEFPPQDENVKILGADLGEKKKNYENMSRGVRVGEVDILKNIRLDITFLS